VTTEIKFEIGVSFKFLWLFYSNFISCHWIVWCAVDWKHFEIWKKTPKKKVLLQVRFLKKEITGEGDCFGSLEGVGLTLDIKFESNDKSLLKKKK